MASRFVVWIHNSSTWKELVDNSLCLARRLTSLASVASLWERTSIPTFQNMCLLHFCGLFYLLVLYKEAPCIPHFHHTTYNNNFHIMQLLSFKLGEYVILKSGRILVGGCNYTWKILYMLTTKIDSKHLKSTAFTSVAHHLKSQWRLKSIALTWSLDHWTTSY